MKSGRWKYRFDVVNVQNEPGGISGLALSSSPTGNSSQNWSTVPLWESVNPSDLVPVVGGADSDSLHNETPVTSSSGIFQWRFNLNADAGEQVESIELSGLQVTGRNFASFGGFIIGNGWSQVIPNESFSTQADRNPFFARPIMSELLRPNGVSFVTNRA